MLKKYKIKNNIKYTIKLKFEKQVLNNALRLLNPAISTKTINEMFKYVYLFKDGLAAYNGTFGVMVLLPGIPDINKYNAIYGPDLLKFIEHLSSDKIILEIIQNNKKSQIRISKISKSGESLLATFPLRSDKHTNNIIKENLNKLKTIEWTHLPRGAVDGLVLCAFSASGDLSLEEYQGVYISNKGIMSTDALRVSKFELSTKRFKKPILIPAKIAIALRVLKPSYYSSNGKDLFLKSENMQAFGQVNAWVEKFNIDILTKAFDDWNDQKKYALPKKKLMETLERSAIFVSQDYILDRSVRMILGNGITVSVERKEKGSYTAQIKTGWKLKEQQEIYINPDFMLEALRHGGTEFGISNKKVGKAKGHLYINAGQFKHMIVPSAKA